MTELDRARIGVVSDTHGNRELMARAREILVERERIDRAYHLGDDYADAEWMIDWSVPVVVVPGLSCPEYRSGRTPKFVRERVGGRTHLLAHAPDHLSSADLCGVDVLFGGHSHWYEIASDGSLTWVNPGHMKDCIHRQRVATCALVEASPGGLDVRILSVETGEAIKRETFE